MMLNAKLERLTQLNFELMETLELCLYRTQAFCKKNNIPFCDTTLSELINKTTCLIDEIDTIPYIHTPLADEKKDFNGNRRFLTDKFKRNKTDEDLTEPKSAILINPTERLHHATS